MIFEKNPVNPVIELTYVLVPVIVVKYPVPAVNPPVNFNVEYEVVPVSVVKYPVPAVIPELLRRC